MSFFGQVAPVIDHSGIESAREISGVTFVEQQTYDSSEKVMKAACDWLVYQTRGKRATIWSDNPAFDWQFWNWYCYKFVGENPAGFSARRIGDLDSGRRNEPSNTSAWKKQRKTLHTHNPVDDARGNAEALRWILEQMGQRP